MLALIQQHRRAVEELCLRHRVQRLELFGSGARGEFDSTRSDLDFLVDFEDLGWQGSSARYFGLLHGLEDLFHRRIDLVERGAIRNAYFLQVAERDRELLYAP